MYCVSLFLNEKLKLGFDVCQVLNSVLNQIIESCFCFLDFFAKISKDRLSMNDLLECSLSMNEAIYQNCLLE